MSHTYAGRAERKKHTHTHTQQEGTWTRAAAAAVAGRVGAGVGHGDGDGDGGRERSKQIKRHTSHRCPATRRKQGWRADGATAEADGGRTIWDVSVVQWKYDDISSWPSQMAGKSYIDCWPIYARHVVCVKFPFGTLPPRRMLLLVA